MTVFGSQWNQRQEIGKCVGNTGRSTLEYDPREIQQMNNESAILFDELYEPHFKAPFPFPKDHVEYIGVEYVLSQSSSFQSQSYYLSQGMKMVNQFYL